MENTSNNDPVTKVRSWRYNEDGTYNNKPTSPTYFKDYYHQKLKVLVECEFCHKMTGAQKLKRHHSTNVCKKFQNL